MAVIKDIRLYRSCFENIDGNSHPSSFNNTELNAIIHRIVMKLRENNFSFDNFDHLYINFTICNVDEKMSLSKRKIDKYHQWYRYYDVEINQELFDKLESKQCIEEILKIIEELLCKFFSYQDFDDKKIKSCLFESIQNGEKMLMKFKEKEASNLKAIIYLRYLDSCYYFPLLRVYDSNDKIILEKDLPKTTNFDDYGTIQLSSKKVVIKPRKNSYSDISKEMIFEL